MADQKGENKEGDPKAAKDSTDPKVSLQLKRGDYQVHVYLEEARGLVPEEEG